MMPIDNIVTKDIIYAEICDVGGMGNSISIGIIISMSLLSRK